jgi:hypothetical protein
MIGDHNTLKPGQHLCPVRRWALDAFDHKHFHRTLLRIELQAKLLLQRSEQ